MYAKYAYVYIYDPSFVRFSSPENHKIVDGEYVFQKTLPVSLEATIIIMIIVEEYRVFKLFRKVAGKHSGHRLASKW